jgi:HEPN domain-containing protein
MKDDVAVFLDRARKFDDASKFFFDKGIYDLAAFHVEQAFQLYLKYILARELGYFPRTHSIYKLFKEASKIDAEFRSFYEEHEIILKDVEDAYLLARYFPREYSKTEVEKMLKVMEEFKERFEKWTS